MSAWQQTAVVAKQVSLSGVATAIFEAYAASNSAQGTRFLDLILRLRTRQSGLEIKKLREI